MVQSGVVNAELDEIQQHLQSQFDVPLRWDNIEGAPAWVAGVSPRYHFSDGLHFITLKPGEFTTLRVPKGAYLRLYHPSQRLSNDEVNIQYSSGSGLYANLPAAISTDGHSLITHVDISKPSLIRVVRPETQIDELQLALFISRFEPVGEIAPYRDVIALPTPSLQMRRSDQAASQIYWQLHPKEVFYPITVTGPARYAFEHRLAFPETESRMRQAYRVSVDLNGEPYQTMAFETVVERTASVYVNWRQRVMGRLETGYINIPEGRHELKLNTTATVYGRLLQQVPSDYLFPSFNQPDVIDIEDYQQAITAPKDSIWSLEQPQIIQEAIDAAAAPAKKEYLAQRLARDNSHREGGMHATLLMRNSAMDHLHDTKIQAIASDMLGFHTFYRNLLPSLKTDESPQSVNWFIAKQLHDVGEQNKPQLDSDQHLRDMLSRLSYGLFVDLLGDETVGHQKQNLRSPCHNANCYYLPSRAGSGLLRLIVDLENMSVDSSLMVQIGDDKPTYMQVNVSPELADSAYTENLALTGLARLQQRTKDIGLAPTMDGAFARQQMSSPMIRAGIFEFEVPVDTNQVRIWKLGSSANKIRVALQQRTSRPSTFSEMEYLGMAVQLSGEDNIYHQFINAFSGGEHQSIVEKELANHWLPLMRFLKPQYELYLSTVVHPKQKLTQVHGLDLQAINQLRSKAEQAQTQGQWLVALEIWNKIQHGSRANTAIQREAELARTEALYQLGEHFLMEQQLRGLLLHTQDQVLRKAVFEKLSAYFQEIEDDEKRQLLLITMLHIDPEPRYLRELSEVLLQNGQYEMALMVGLVVPENKMSLTTIIQAAYQLGWWDVFHTMVNRLPNTDKKAFWQAQFFVEQGDYSAALEYFKAAGELGSQWYQAIQNGLRIRNDLSSRAANAVSEWVQWHTDHPEPYQWREAHNIVVDYAGAVSLYNSGRDMASQAYLATAEKPVKLSFIGPLKIRIDARPIHAIDNDEPINGWLELRSTDNLRLLPINNNRQTDWPIVVGHDGLAVGQRAFDEFNFGPGHHEIELSGNALSLLISVFVQRPVYDLGLLPPLNQDSLAQFNNQSTDIDDEQLGFNADLVSRMDVSDWPEAKYLAEGRVEQAILIYSNQNKEKSQRLMTLLLWLAEQQPEQQGRALVLGEALAEAHSEVPQLRPLLARLAKDAGWLQIVNMQRSAGLRFVEITGWQPESPARRVRKALMEPTPVDEHVITGTNRLVLKINNLSPTTFNLSLLQDDIRYLKPVSSTVFYQIDDQPPVYVELTLENPLSLIEIPMPIGQHTLRIGIDNPVTNQFVSVGISEADDVLLTRSIERVYHVATHQEPVIVNIAGPAWLRIDTLIDGEIQTSYRHVESDWQEIKIVPNDDDKESLVRVSQRLHGLREFEIPDRRIAVLPNPVSDPLVAVVLKQNPAQMSLHDGYPLGRQEDGTWSLNTAAVSRRNFGNFSGDNDSERFFESSATHRYFNQNRRLYLKTDILGRSREHGSPTFGILESLIYQPLLLPLIFKLDGSLHVQQYNLFGDKSEEWAAYFNAAVSQRREINPKTWYIPELSVFQRAMSLSSSTADDDRLDQDIFTQYRADHQRGVSVSNVLKHRPWLDTIWYTQFSVVSNENGNVFKPDHLMSSAGWRQLIGQADVDLGYRLVHFFADANRVDASNRHSIFFNFAWNQWRINQQRIELGLRFRRDFDITSYNGLVYLSWHFGRGRMYRDFHASELSFMDIRKQHIPQKINNRIGVSGD